MYAPGQFFLMGLIFKIFGFSIKVGRILGLILIFLTALDLFFIIKKLGHKKLAPGLFLLGGIWLKTFGSYPAPVLTAVFTGMLGSLLFIHYLIENNKIWLCLFAIHRYCNKNNEYKNCQ